MQQMWTVTIDLYVWLFLGGILLILLGIGAVRTVFVVPIGAISAGLWLLGSWAFVFHVLPLLRWAGM